MKKISLSLIFLSTLLNLYADEGMFIPMLLGEQRIARMQALGLKLSASDIYDINQSSLKDAIVQFGRGCTGAIISDEGLVLTNHHCGFGAIQSHSTLEHDYITDGFWAASKDSELSNAGLTVTMLVRMEEVTQKVLAGVHAKMTETERGKTIRENIKTIETGASKEEYQDARVRSFYYGNQYFLFVTETYKDVRLVGAPPSDIGDFGGDTDNWMWPRHTGDFSIFRIYAGKDNKPADYSKENIPYKPKKFLTISLQGYSIGDFTFIFGFPGSTKEYLPSFGVDLIAFQENPVKIRLRQARLDIINAAMEEDPLTRIQYASKHAGIANYWKKMIGETRGIQRMDALTLKKGNEQKFRTWTGESAEREARYGNLLSAFEKAYSDIKPSNMAYVYYTEAGMAIEMVKFASGFIELINICQKDESSGEEVEKEIRKLIPASRGFFKNYQVSVDRKIASRMMAEMIVKMDTAYSPGIFAGIDKKYKGDVVSYTDDLFRRTIFADSAALLKLLKDGKKEHIRKLKDDPGFLLASGISSGLNKRVIPELTKRNAILDSLQRIYVAALMEMSDPDGFYPDANATLRISYGVVDTYSPADAVTYNYYTTAGGILDKEDASVPDYKLSPATRQLLLSADYGRYADRDGTLHVAFTASNHTTGGNSGSPVLNADGLLIGINFDRNWEGTMSDLVYNPDQCRNIALDIRYCLFVIEQVGKADYLLKEMNIIE